MIRLRDFEGPLTRELLREPGRFGLGQVPSAKKPDGAATTVCGYCSTGCGLKVHLRAGEAVNLSADPAYPVNLGMACPKGWESLTPLRSPDRGTQPLLRDGQNLRPVEWDEALKTFVERMKSIREKHGPESVAYLSTGQICTEEMFLVGTLFKFGMGFRHADANTRQCMATAHVAYKQGFGFDAPPFTYKDFEQSDTLIFIGANPAIAHPILWERVMLNPNAPDILVLDPRRTETAQAATVHYPIAPKSDLPLLYSLAHELIRTDALDRGFIAAHTEGFDEYARHVADYPAEVGAAAAGLPVESVRDLAARIARGKAVSMWWTMGVNQSHEAVRTAQAIMALCLMTGNIGRPGTGPNSITGQMNAMGSRLFSNTTGLPGGRDFSNASHRREVSERLDIPLDAIPQEASWAYDQILEAVGDGRIKGLWIIATNPNHSWVNQAEVDGWLDKLEFLVVQDMYPDTDTARKAHLYLPAGWGEKEGTVINSERRIGRFRKVAKAPGQALADYHIFRLIGAYWGEGCSPLIKRMPDPEAAFREMQRLSEGRPCDISGIEGYAHIESRGGIQWPYPADSADTATERRLFADGKFFTASGKAKFLADPVRPPEELPDADYPFILLTGRGTSAQWHTGTRTQRSAVLRRLYPAECYVEIHPEDAARLGLDAGVWCEVRTRRGAVKARVLPLTGVGKGNLFLPMHYEGVNRLTAKSFDPYSRQPSFKHSAAAVSAA